MARTSTRFFTVILPTTIQEQKLKIPGSFVTRFGHELSGVATLQVWNNADIWKMKLVKIGEDLYFRDGWHRFLQHHSIEERFFLVFDYIGNSSFDVIIFDRYNTQVHFGEQMDADADVDEGNEVEDDEDEEISIGILHSNQPRSRKDNCTSSRKQGFKIRRTKLQSNCGCSMQKWGKNTRKGAAENPTLTVTLKQYNVRPGCFLNVPNAFARECTKQRPQFFILRNVFDRTECLVNLIAFKSQRICSGCKTWKISRGWANFVHRNDLHEGDVCNFEFIKRTANVVQVTIFRANEGAQS